MNDLSTGLSLRRGKCLYRGLHCRVEVLGSDRLGEAGELELLLHACSEPGNGERDLVTPEVLGQRLERLEPCRVGMRVTASPSTTSHDTGVRAARIASRTRPVK